MAAHKLVRVWICVSVIAFLAGCGRKQTKVLLAPAETLGQVVAEEAIQLAGSKKSIAIIVPDSNWGPVSTVEQALTQAFTDKGISVKMVKRANLGDPMHAGGVGLMAADFLEVLAQSADAGAIVSLSGGPLFLQGKPTAGATIPVLVVATASLGNIPGVPGDRNQLRALVDSAIVKSVVVDGTEATPKTDSLHQVFAQHFMHLR